MKIRPSIDLHCHILPAIDDGARDLSDAVEMARSAQADGIAAICATPHIRHDHDVRIAELPERIEELSVAIRSAGCGTRILPGGEVAATALDGLDDVELRAVTLGGGGRWILLEPAPGPLDDAFAAAVHRLGERGFRALIAHPERHLAPELFSRLRGLVDDGALIQATAAYFTHRRFSEGMLALAREGLVHVLSSDSHSSLAGRPVALSDALGALAAVSEVAAHLEWIAQVAPEGIAAGEELVAPF
jgi:protein-tyrosine phosphatase